MEHLSNDQQGHPKQHKDNDKLCSGTRYPILSLIESWWKLRQLHDQIFSKGEKVISELILASEERKKSKRAGLWESWSGIQVGKLTTWVRSLVIYISSSRICQPVLMTGIKVPKDKYISRCVDQKNLIFVRWHSIKDHA